MTTVAATSEYTIDSILDQLDNFHQRATYGAVAGVVDSSPRSLMSGRERNQKSSWIVSRKDGKPTGYEAEHVHPNIAERDQILETADALRGWLRNPT
jgi:hypothetical protein